MTRDPAENGGRLARRDWHFGRRVWMRIALVAGGLLASLALMALLVTALAYRNLPSLEPLTDYRPKMPMRVFTADRVLIGEFGEERRTVVAIGEVPAVMKHAIVAAEDGRFYEHGGVDPLGILRAIVSNTLHSGSRWQGASTITQQVARNFFLSSERSLTRKFYEILLAYRIESALSKDQILELYLNQIYLGQRAYGFASAENVYYGKPLADVTAGEAAMLAGIPKAPSLYNPVVNPMRARARQKYVLDRMQALGYLTQAEHDRALNENTGVRAQGTEYAVHAEYVAELARQLACEQLPEGCYTRGLNVYTTVVSGEQTAAYRAVRSGILAFERRQHYEGPEGFVELPSDLGDLDETVDEALLEHRDADDILAAVVLEATPKSVTIERPGDLPREIRGSGLRLVAAALSDKVPENRRLRRGAIIRIVKNSEGIWEITQLPKVEAALVAGSSEDGAVHALVGGFDFGLNRFNHVTQAWRQPGSGFKPFLYSAALERGFTPASIVNDAPILLDAAQTGSRAWEPRNYDGKFDGPMTLRDAIARSKNMVSIRLIEAITPEYVRSYVERFGLDPQKQPPYLTMALGAGSVTPLQMMGAYSVFANGGYKVNPYLVTRITDSHGVNLARTDPARANDESNRVIDARNAFVMDSLLKGVAAYGTAANATRALKRTDIGGKTGTTNESKDAWFSGYINQGEVAVVWIGYDQPRSLGASESGGGLALPLWIAYMQTAVKGVPEKERALPVGIITVAGEYYYSEFGPDASVISLGLDEPTSNSPSSPTVFGSPVAAVQAPQPAQSLSEAVPDRPAHSTEMSQPSPYGTLRN